VALVLISRASRVPLRGQANGALTFYGRCVDQDGNPLAGVTVSYECESFPSNRSFERRGDPLLISTVSAMSRDDGTFQFTVEGHVLKRKSVSAPAGYRHLFEEYEGTLNGVVIPSTFGYLITSSEDRCYKSDVEHPAIFVFVKEGEKLVSALPCRGGFDSGNGTSWTQNKPAWPKKPSLRDVSLKPAAG